MTGPIGKALRLLAAALALAASAAAADMATVKSRVFDNLTTPSVSESSIAESRATLQPDGTWPDVDYASTVVTNWPPTTHLTRMRDLARAYAKPGSPLEGDPSLLADTLRAYDAWIAEDPTSSNWYHNQINTPQKLGETMILLEQELSSARLSAGLAIVARSYVSRSTNSGTNTGANRVDRAYASLMRGLLDNNTSLVSESFLAIGDTILVTTSEGIQPDQSFQQHGAQLYVQGYGQVYLSGVMKYTRWAAGTSFAFDELQRRVLVDFLLDGVQWFIRGNTADFTASGRGLTREGQSSTAAGFLGALGDAQYVAEGYRAGELAAFLQRLAADVSAGTASPLAAISGHRHYWRSDSTICQRPDFAVFLKTSSTRTLQPETGNGEGLKNLHLGDGVTLIQAHGNEYDDIMPVWNWRALPGTTTEQGAYSLKPASDWGVAGTSTHAGGVSDGMDGCTAFRYQRLGVTALKSWFFIGNRMVALGAGIEAPSASDPVITTVNQCLLHGAVTYSTAPGDSAALGMQSLNPSGLRWVHHDGVGCYFPEPAGNATLAAESRTGTWQAINSSQSADPVTKDVFSLHLDHGHPVSGGGYAYVIAPVATAGEMEGNPLADIQIDRNDGTAQAVTDTAAGLTEANFWVAGVAAGVTSSAASCVMVREHSGVLELSLADPTQANNGDLVIELDRAVAGTLHAETGITVESLAPTLRLRAAMANSKGRSLHARFYLRPHAYQNLTIAPAADAFVYDANPDTAYGTGTSLTAKLLSTPGWTRFSFLRFELPPLASPPVAATLRLNATTSQTPGTHSVHGVTPSPWTEGGLTWNTRPAPSGPAVALWYPTVGKPVLADLSALLPGITTSGGPLELKIEPVTRTNDGLVNYASRENTDPSLRPSLELMVPRPEIEIWRIEAFGESASDALVAGDTADPDGDGLPNAIEFVLGTEPNPASAGSDSSAFRPAGRVEGDRFIYSFRRSHVSADGVIVEASSGLHEWTRLLDQQDGVIVTTTPEPGESGIDRVEVSIPRGEATRFLRLGFSR